MFAARQAAAGLGPLLFGGLFWLFGRPGSGWPFWPGAPFVCGAALSGVALVVALGVQGGGGDDGASVPSTAAERSKVPPISSLAWGEAPEFLAVSGERRSQ